MFSDMWRDGLLGKFLLFLLISMGVGIIFLFGLLIFSIADTSFLSYEHGSATITNKHIEPAHQSTTFITISSGKTTTLVPQTTYYPESYTLTLSFKVNGEEVSGDKSVQKNYFDQVQLGRVIDIDFAKNRFSQDYTIK
jgi:hypothetical protein